MLNLVSNTQSKYRIIQLIKLIQGRTLNFMDEIYFINYQIVPMKIPVGFSSSFCLTAVRATKG